MLLNNTLSLHKKLSHKKLSHKNRKLLNKKLLYKNKKSYNQLLYKKSYNQLLYKKSLLHNKLHNNNQFSNKSKRLMQIN